MPYTEKETFTGRGTGRAGDTFGEYVDPSETNGHANPFARFEALPDMFRKLAGDVTSVISLQIALLKAELMDGIKGYGKGTMFLLAAILPAALTFLFLQIALGFLIASFLPFSQEVNYALGFGIVTLLNAMVAGVLVWLAMKQFKAHTLKPERSIKEIEREKQWLTNEVA